MHSLIIINQAMILGRVLRLTAQMSKAKPKSNEARIKELFGEYKEAGAQECLIAQKKLRNDDQKRLAQNQKVRNYHYYEYYRGQDLIENIPYIDYEKYTLKDKIKQDKDKQRRAIQEMQPITNHVERAKIIREKVTAYHDKQRKFQIEQFEKYLSLYPGTVRGPRPEDDWEAYRNYGMKKLPKIVLDEITEKMRLQDQTQKERTALDDEFDVGTIESPVNILSYFGKDRQLQNDQEEGQSQKGRIENEESAFEADKDMPLLDQFKTEVPLIPNTPFQNYQSFINHWMNWHNFRNHYVEANKEANSQKQAERLDRLCESLDKDPSNEYIQIASNIPSLSRYYRCLPQQLQDNPGLKDIYLGLQYTAPDFTYEEKQQALNYTCRLLLPFDDVSTKFMTDYISKSRLYPTPFMFDKIFTISPEFTWDLTTFLDEIRKQELRGEAIHQNKDVKFPQPPQVHLMWMEGSPNLPVDYYDNQDGFWDSVISQKLKRYDSHQPMMKTRKYFTH